MPRPAPSRNAACPAPPPSRAALWRLGLLLLAILVPVHCTDGSTAEPRFVIAYTDPPRLHVGSEDLIHVTVAAVYAFEDAMAQLEDAPLPVDFKHSGVLGSQLDTLDQVLTGAIQATTPAVPALAGYYPDIQILSVPYLWRSPLVAWTVLDGPFGRRFFDRMADASGLRVLAIFDNGGYRSFSNGVREVRSPDDLAGLKLRVIESPTEMKIVESLGATPTPIAWNELYSALQTGVVDGQENSPATLVSGSLHEVQRFYTLDHHTLSLAALVVSEEWFRSRPPGLQRSLRLAGRMASVAGRGAAWTNNKLALEYLAAEGMQIYRPDAAEREAFRTRAQPAVIDWMRASPEIDTALLDELLAAVSEAERELGF